MATLPAPSCTTASHAALKSSPLWPLLRLVGLQPDEDDNGRQQTLELRNCACGSTLAVVVPAEPWVDPDSEPTGVIENVSMLEMVSQ